MAAEQPEDLSTANGLVLVGLAGPVSVLGPQREVRLSGQSAAAMARLTLGRHKGVRAYDLAEAVWGQKLPRSWEGSLRAVLSRLRGLLRAAGLGHDVLRLDSGRYYLVLPAGSRVDVEEATSGLELASAQLGEGDPDAALVAAREAEQVFRQGFLPEADCEWAEAVRHSHHRALVEAIELQAEAYLKVGQPGKARAAAEAAISLEPLREPAYRLLMRAHAAEGSLAEALRTYGRCRHLLIEELGVTPSEATEALYLQLLGPGRPVPSARPALPAALAGLAGGTVDREQELGLLKKAWREACAGAGQVVALRGEAGIGKTTLCAMLAAELSKDGSPVLYGSCDPELDIPYQPFAEALRGYCQALTPGSAAVMLGPLAGELERLVPELGHILPSTLGPLEGDAGTQLHRLFEAVRQWLCASAARTAMLVVLDDLHWAGGSTARMLRYLLRWPLPEGLMLLLCWRGEELAASSPFAGVATVLSSREGTLEVPLGGLRPESVAPLVQAAGWPDAPRRAQEICAWAGGNPLYICEVLKGSPDSWEEGQLPARLAALVQARVARLSPLAASIVKAGAVLGPEFELALAAEVVGATEAEALRAGAEAEAAGVLKAVAGQRPRAAFGHFAARAAIIESLGELERADLHRRAAEAMQRRPPPLASSISLAYHAKQSGGLVDPSLRVRYSTLAAEEVAAATAFSEAAGYLEDALRSSEGTTAQGPGERLELTVKWGEALSRARDPAHYRVLSSTAREALEAGDIVLAARAALAINRMLVTTSVGSFDPDYVGLLRSIIDRRPPPAFRARLLAALAAELMWDTPYEERASLARRALRSAAHAGDQAVVASVLTGTHLAASCPSNVRARLRQAKQLCEMGKELGKPEVVFRGHLFCFDALMELGRSTEASAELTAAQLLAAELKDYYLWEVAVRRSGRALLAGEVERAEQLAEQTLQVGLAGEVPPDGVVAVYGAQLIMVRFEQGRLGEIALALRHLETSQPGWAVWKVVSSFVAYETGDHATAGAHLADLGKEGFACLQRNLTWLGNMCMLSMVASQLGELEACTELFSALRPYSGRLSWGLAVSAGPTDYALGALAHALGEHSTAQRFFERAYRLSARIGARSWAERARCKLAAQDMA